MFDLLNLKDLDVIKDEVKLAKTNLGGMPGGPAVSVPLEVGDIYVGRINARDMSTGRPSVIEFKILATDVSHP